MTEIILTHAPGATYEILDVSGASVKELAKVVSKDTWQKVHAASAKHKSAVAHAFAEVYVDGTYDDELSGELTIALDDKLRPKVKPVPRVKAPPKSEPAVEPEKQAKVSTPRNQSVSAQVKAVVAEHLGKSREDLLPIVREVVDAPDPRLKSCIKHWLEKLS